MRNVHLHFFFWVVMGLNACSPGDPQPVDDTTSLYAITASDSLIDFPATVDFSRVSQLGTGPSGRVIRMTSTTTPTSVITYTYDGAGNLTGIYQPLSYGYDSYQLGDYYDGLLKRSYLGFGDYNGSPSSVGLVGMTIYRHNQKRQLVMALQYSGISTSSTGWQTTRGRLNQVHEFHYDATGQLETTRLSYSFGRRYEATWKEGNITQEQQFMESSPNTTVHITYTYDQYSNTWAQQVPLQFPTYNFGTRNNRISSSQRNCIDLNCYEQPSSNMEHRLIFDQQGRINKAEFRHIYSPASSSSWMGHVYTYSK
ncbi:hypothetical protein [Spirosoma rhododendri]|uniref:YD repeat-containing protein n=1 Tax=Spirosoma rhododendri TaxID=2728024 RepID=A0A7L5DPV5_9BACT|nr:hypothetical protein [Spirosoma rhododendri]QJD79233.1 hypothetical protein HH216_13025 [Spirosoma rhododendri]